MTTLVIDDLEYRIMSLEQVANDLDALDLPFANDFLLALQNEIDELWTKRDELIKDSQYELYPVWDDEIPF